MNIGRLKSPPANADAMCLRCMRIWSIELCPSILGRDLDRAARLLEQEVMRGLLLVEAHALIGAVVRCRVLMLRRRWRRQCEREEQECLVMTPC